MGIFGLQNFGAPRAKLSPKPNIPTSLLPEGRGAGAARSLWNSPSFVTSLFPKSDTLHKFPMPATHPGKTRQLRPLSSTAQPEIPAGIFQPFPQANCATLPRIPTRLPWDQHPRAAEGSEFRDRNLGIVPGARGGRGTKIDPSSGGILWEVEGWDTPPTKAENQPNKDGKHPGLRAGSDPGAPGMPLARRGCVGYSQFPKPLASTASRAPNPSGSNT